MEEKLLELLYNYSKNNKLADIDFIVKVVSIVTNYKRLNDYVKKIEYNSYNKFDNSSLLGYNFDERKIIIYDEKLNIYLNQVKANDVFIPNKEKLFYKNVEVLEALLHELEHANQSKIMENEKTEEAEILKLVGVGKSRELISMELKKIGLSKKLIENLLNNKMKIYYKYYDFAPHERLAEINSHQKMSEILSPIKNFVPNIYKLENTLVLKNKLKGYTFNHKLISPTVLYLKEQGEENNLRNFCWYDIEDNKCLELSKRFYNSEKRIRLGLPIDNYEYNNLNNEYTKFVKSL